VGEYGWGAQSGAGDGANSDAVDLLPVGRCPDLGAKQAETALHEAVVQVGEHDVVAAGGDFRVERDGPLQAGVRMDEAGRHGCQDGSANRGTAKACGMPSSAVGMRRGWRARSSAMWTTASMLAG
jgi:hypothetical protein